VAYATLGLLFLFPLGQYAWQSHRQVASLRSAVNIKKTSFEQYKYIFQEHERVKAENSQLDARLAQLPKLDISLNPLAAALRLISQKIPENMSLTNMDFEKQEGGGLAVRMRGLIYGEKEDAFPMLTNFMEELGKAKIFSEVELEGAGDQRDTVPSVLGFEIGCTLK
jgi:hypothetical protein